MTTILPTCVLGALIVLVVLVAPARGSELKPTAVRLAIVDLMRSFGNSYPQGAEFLALLEPIEQRLQTADETALEDARADLARLQRRALLANPLATAHPILFVVRHQYRPDHHNTATFFPSAKGEYNDGQFTPGAALKVLDLLRAGKVTTLLETTEGVIRDPEVHFDGDRILVSLRTHVTDSYHLYELRSDGSGLRQRTFAPDVDDLDPLYLPDDGIAFSSTREPKYCMCNRHIMANLFRMEADGANIHQIGKSTLFEGHGSLLPDGRILYDRWEYVDRNFGDAQSLWTVNPDGTAHAHYWGNYTASPGAVIDARAVPGTDLVLAVLGSCHDRPWGALALIDRTLGLDGQEPVLQTWPRDARELVRSTGWEVFDTFVQVRPKYEDPFPLSDRHFLAARMTGTNEVMGLYLLDVFGNEILLHAESPGCFDPMPLGPRPRPPGIPKRRDYAGGPGTVFVQDVYQGYAMRSVPRGTIQRLRVVESPEKRFWTMPPWGGQGQEAPAMNWHDFNNKRILGEVPVAPDGSACFELPSERFVYFQLLDADGLMVQSMRSGTLVQPGERAGCIGCHEDRRQAPAALSSPPLALRQPPAILDGWYGPPRDFNYLAEVQPVFDRHCVRCHDYGTEAGQRLNLAPDRDLVFNTSYNELWRKKYVKVVGAGPADTQPPYSWGAHPSPLVRHLRSDPTCGASLSREDWNRIVTWIDLNAPYYPSYACAYPDHFGGRSPLDDVRLERLATLTGVPLRQLGGHATNRGPQVSFDRPELSPCLASLAADPTRTAYQEALALIRYGRDQLRQRPEADAPDFQPNPTDRWREAKYQSRQRQELLSREALHVGARFFEGPAEPPR